MSKINKLLEWMDGTPSENGTAFDMRGIIESLRRMEDAQKSIELSQADTLNVLSRLASIVERIDLDVPHERTCVVWGTCEVEVPDFESLSPAEEALASDGPTFPPTPTHDADALERFSKARTEALAKKARVERAREVKKTQTLAVGGGAIQVERGGEGVIRITSMYMFQRATIRAEAPFVIEDVIVGGTSALATMPSGGRTATREVVIGRCCPGQVMAVHVAWPVPPKGEP